MTKIEKADLEIFKKHFPLYETIKKANFVKNYTRQTYSELLKLYEKYVSSKHSFAFHCGDCRFFLIKFLFQFYETEMSKQIVVEPEPEIQGTAIQEPEQNEIPEPKKRKYKKREPKSKF